MSNKVDIEKMDKITRQIVEKIGLGNAFISLTECIGWEELGAWQDGVVEQYGIILEGLEDE